MDAAGTWNEAAGRWDFEGGHSRDQEEGHWRGQEKAWWQDNEVGRDGREDERSYEEDGGNPRVIG